MKIIRIKENMRTNSYVRKYLTVNIDGMYKCIAGLSDEVYKGKRMHRNNFKSVFTTHSMHDKPIFKNHQLIDLVEFEDAETFNDRIITLRGFIDKCSDSATEMMLTSMRVKTKNDDCATDYLLWHYKNHYIPHKLILDNWVLSGKEWEFIGDWWERVNSIAMVPVTKSDSGNIAHFIVNSKAAGFMLPVPGTYINEMYTLINKVLADGDASLDDCLVQREIKGSKINKHSDAKLWLGVAILPLMSLDGEHVDALRNDLKPLVNFAKSLPENKRSQI